MLWCDNMSATYQSANPIFYAYTKHVEVDYHFVHDKKDIQIHFIFSNDQLAIVLIRPLLTASFIDLWFKFQVDPPPSA